MNGVWDYLKGVFKLTSLATTFVSILLLGATFTVALLWSLGSEVLPLVDKAHLLVLLSFYAGGITVVVRFIKGNWDMWRVIALNSVEDWVRGKVMQALKARPARRDYGAEEIMRITERIERMKRAHLWPHGLMLAPLALIAIGWAIDLWPRVSDLLEVKGVLGVVLNLGFGLFMLLGGAVMAARGMDQRLYRYPVALGNLLLFFATVNAGPAWLNYLREEAPRLHAVLKANVASISIAMPATTGIIAYVDGDEDVTFIPWSEIVQIEAVAATPRQDAATPPPADPTEPPAPAAETPHTGAASD